MSGERVPVLGIALAVPIQFSSPVRAGTPARLIAALKEATGPHRFSPCPGRTASGFRADSERDGVSRKNPNPDSNEGCRTALEVSPMNSPRKLARAISPRRPTGAAQCLALHIEKETVCTRE